MDALYAEHCFRVERGVSPYRSYNIGSNDPRGTARISTAAGPIISTNFPIGTSISLIKGETPLNPQTQVLI
jgi:hypothetical protein